MYNMRSVKTREPKKSIDTLIIPVLNVVRKNIEKMVKY